MTTKIKPAGDSKIPELVINATNIISPLCYTVLKLEPYTVCPFRCSYCYSKWYMKSPTKYVFPRYKALKMFEKIVKKIYRNGLKPIPFRLSTLVDPFPPQEQLYRVSEKILAIALDYEYPLIINTKSMYFSHQFLKNYVEKLLDRNLAVLQISLSTLDDDKAQKIEFRAPEPSKRFEIVKQIGSTDVPLILRLSPYIPYISPTTYDEIKNFVLVVKEIGFKHVIVESLRMEHETIKNFIKNLGINELELDNYSLKKVEELKPLARISHSIVENIYKLLLNELSKHRITFATCKEGLFDLHTSSDCCGVYLIKNSVLRTTLYDIYKYIVETNLNYVKYLQNEEHYLSICRKYSRICSTDITLYPKIIAKHLKYHEKKMLKTLRNPDLLKHIAPHLIKKLELTTLDRYNKHNSINY